jgi:hypothetical protein
MLLESANEDTHPSAFSGGVVLLKPGESRTFRHFVSPFRFHTGVALYFSFQRLASHGFVL